MAAGVVAGADEPEEAEELEELEELEEAEAAAGVFDALPDDTEDVAGFDVLATVGVPAVTTVGELADDAAVPDEA